MRKPKNTTIKLSPGLKVSVKIQYETMRKYIKKRWWLIALTWLSTIGIAIITAFLITGWLGVLIGSLLSAIPFYLGTIAIMVIVQRDIYHEGQSA